MFRSTDGGQVIFVSITIYPIRNIDLGNTTLRTILSPLHGDSLEIAYFIRFYRLLFPASAFVASVYRRCYGFKAGVAPHLVTFLCHQFVRGPRLGLYARIRLRAFDETRFLDSLVKFHVHLATRRMHSFYSCSFFFETELADRVYTSHGHPTRERIPPVKNCSTATRNFSFSRIYHNGKEV